MFVKSLLAGISIAIGCIASLSVGGGALGAFLFSIGLILICVNGFNLYTGKIPYAKFESYKILDMACILIGNLIASLAMGLITSLVRPELVPVAYELMESKYISWYGVILSGMLCNVLIFFAVDYYNWRKQNNIDGIVVIIMCVMVFILTKSDHCIANTFYLALSRNICTVEGIRFLLLNILGNTIGGILIYRVTEGYSLCR